VGTGATGNSRTQIVQSPSAHVQALSSGHWHRQAACARSDTGRRTQLPHTLGPGAAAFRFRFRDELSRESTQPAPAPEAAASSPRAGNKKKGCPNQSERVTRLRLFVNTAPSPTPPRRPSSAFRRLAPAANFFFFTRTGRDFSSRLETTILFRPNYTATRTPASRHVSPHACQPPRTPTLLHGRAARRLARTVLNVAWNTLLVGCARGGIASVE